jgi:hypothetical protein
MTLQELDPEIAAAADEIEFDGLTVDTLAEYRAKIRPVPMSKRVVRSDVTVPGDPACADPGASGARAW